MGNCNSSASHRRAAADTLASDLLWKERSTTEYMDLQNESDENTLPLSSPESTLVSDGSPLNLTPSPLSTSSLGDSNVPPTPTLCQTLAGDLVASSPVYTPKRTSSPTTRQGSVHSRPGKALQHRLEKARNLQTILSKSTIDELDEGEHEQISNRPSQLSSSSILSSAAKTLNDDFEATMSEGMIWAEAQLGDAVACIAMSRRQASLDTGIPALYTAVGTKSGKICIYELMEDAPLSAPRTIPEEDASDNDEASLGLDDLKAQQPLSRRLRTASTFQHAGGRIRTMDFSPDGSFVAVGGDDCMCTLYALLYEGADEDGADDDDTLVGAELYGEIQRVDRVCCVQFSPDGRFLAVGGFDGTVAVVLRDDILNSHAPDVTVEISRDGLIFALDWSPDSRYLAVGGSDKCCAIVDTQTSWNVMREIRRSSAVTDVKWYPASGASLAIASNNVAIVDRIAFDVRYEFEVLEAAPTKSLARSMGKVNRICWSPNGTYIVACGSANKCTLFETKSYMPVYEISRSQVINTLFWGQQSVTSGTPRRYLAIGGEDERVIIVKAGLELNSASSVADDLSLSSNSLLSQRSEWTFKESAFRDVDDVPHQLLSDQMESTDASDLNVTTLAFSRGSKSRPSTFFSYCLDDGLVVVRSTIDFRVIAELRFSRPMKTLAFSNGSRFLSMGGADGRVFVVETVPSWSVVAQLDFDSPIQTIAYSKHNERLAVGLHDGTLAFLDPQDEYRVCGEIAASSSCISAVDWTSKYFALGRLDGTVAIYDSDQVISNSGSPMTVLQQTSPVRAIAFGASGRFLAVGGSDGLVNIYSSKGDWIRCHHVSLQPGLVSLSWSATGRFLSIAGDGYLRVIETIFWTDFHEASQALLPTDQLQTMSSLAFGQDESMMAVAVAGNGIRILDCKSWKLSFMMNKAVTERSTLTMRSDEPDTNHEHR